MIISGASSTLGVQNLSAKEAVQGPLADYVGKPDDSYGWVKRREGKLLGASYAELTLTSQTWRGIPWKHQLFVIKPAIVDDASQGLLLIGGGRWRPELAGPAPEGNADLPGEAQIVAALAATIKAPVAVLLHVPQQPLFGDMTEDALISYTFEQYLRTNEADWPLLLPMTKSAVKAMDAIQEYSRDAWSLEIENFTVTGASKRGWTTWLAGAIDPRVNAIAPMVIDMLNMPPQMKHQLATWGKFSEEIGDYTERGIQQQIGTPRGKKLNDIVDPYAYRRSLTQPKLILLGTNDRYWPLDALNLYWDDLEGDKYILYVPNNGHGLTDLRRIAGSIAALHLNAAGKLELPKLEWKHQLGETSLTLKLSSDQPPQHVSAWIASSPTRDFREAQWNSVDIEALSESYTHELPFPDAGYAAMFAEAEFDNDGTPYFLSTNVKIIGAKE